MFCTCEQYKDTEEYDSATRPATKKKRSHDEGKSSRQQSPAGSPCFALTMGTYPPEWDPQASVWLSWPSSGPLCSLLPSSNTVIADMAAALAKCVPYVSMLVNGPKDIAAVEQAMKARDVGMEKIKCIVVPHSDEWIRDFGPIFLKVDGRLSVASFGWNYWGCIEHYMDISTEEDCEEASVISRRCADELGLPVVQSSLVSEGGNREFNGAGVLMATASVEKQRNPGLSLEAIEMELKRIFCVQKVIWLEEGVADDDHIWLGPRRYDGKDMLEFNAACTGGHIDEYCKFVGPKTILLAEVPHFERNTLLGALTHSRMERNLAILSSSHGTDTNGERFDIIRIPTPPTMKLPIRREDTFWSWLETIRFENNGHPIMGKDLLVSHSEIQVVLPASYVNMIICNKTILLPKYGCSSTETRWSYLSEEVNAFALETDEMARSVLATHFPDYNIVQIPSVAALNLGGGGMHCTSQQQPIE